MTDDRIVIDWGDIDPETALAALAFARAVKSGDNAAVETLINGRSLAEYHAIVGVLALMFTTAAEELADMQGRDVEQIYDGLIRGFTGVDHNDEGTDQ